MPPQSTNRTDTMAPGTRFDHKSAVLSFEEEVGYDPELDEPITLGELLASDHEEPAMVAARSIDRQLFLAIHNYRDGLHHQGYRGGPRPEGHGGSARRMVSRHVSAQQSDGGGSARILGRGGDCRIHAGRGVFQNE